MCVKTRLLKIFKILLVFILLLAIGLIVGINLTFNMIGSIGYVKVLNDMSRVKGSVNGQDTFGNKSWPSIEVIKRRSLVDTEELRMKAEKIKSDLQISKSDDIKTILWFNKPAWINLYTSNSALEHFCLYKNCRMTENRENIKNHSAIVYALTSPLQSRPPIADLERRPDQAWVFFGLESPRHTSRFGYRHNSWLNTMNWSMSYRTDADIFFPYGILVTRNKPLDRNYSAIYHRKSRHVAWAVSNCGAPSRRDEYVEEMKATDLQIDVYGRCTENVFSDQSRIKEKINPTYLFYLSFENSLCTDYITEKFFRYFEWDVVLVVRGGADYDRLLPNDTFIDASKFSSAAALADYLLHVAKTEDIYTQYLRNKDKYRVDHYPGDGAFCNLCIKLNNLDNNRKSYVDHVTYLHENQCRSPTDIISNFYNTITVCVIVLLLGTVLVFIIYNLRKRRNKLDPVQ